MTTRTILRRTPGLPSSAWKPIIYLSIVSLSMILAVIVSLQGQALLGCALFTYAVIHPYIRIRRARRVES